jgi:hypothetical protein
LPSSKLSPSLPGWNNFCLVVVQVYSCFQLAGGGARSRLKGCWWKEGNVNTYTGGRLLWEIEKRKKGALNK